MPHILAIQNGGLRPRSTLHARPQRVQRSRRRGHSQPEGVIYVGRPTLWGNPFEHRRWGHAKATILHQNWLDGRLGALTLERMGFCPNEIEALERLRARVLTQMHTLADHDLSCWCPLSSDWCHAATLLRMAPIHADLERHAL